MSGEVVCVEAKAAASITARDWRSMEKLRDSLTSRFRAGVLIHAGEQTFPLGDRLWAVPISGLWSNAARR